MKKHLFNRQFFEVLTLLIWSVLFLLFSSSTTKALVLTPGTLSHRVDPVIVTGEQMRELLGVNLDTIIVYSGDLNGQIHEIPFQIDERFPSGAYILIPNNIKGTGKLSKKDELVFMARDAGPKISLEKFPFSSRFIQELELQDKENNKQAWVYVVSSHLPVIQAPIHYIQYDKIENQMIGKTYYLNYFLSMNDPLKPYWQANHQAFAWSEKGEKTMPSSHSSLTPNLLRESKLKIDVATAADLFNWKIDLEDLDTREIGHIIGPVRAIRKIRIRPKILPGLRMKGVTVLQKHYDQFLTTTVQGEMTAGVMATLSKLEVSFLEDFSQNDDIKMEIHKKEDTRSLRNAPYIQLLVKNEKKESMEATTLWRVFSDPNIEKSLSLATFDIDCVRCFRLDFNAKEVPLGEYEFELDRYFPANSSSETIQSFFDMRDDPLRFQATIVKQDLVFRLPR